jgi:hypothetical protein
VPVEVGQRKWQIGKLVPSPSLHLASVKYFPDSLYTRGVVRLKYFCLRTLLMGQLGLGTIPQNCLASKALLSKEALPKPQHILACIICSNRVMNFF